MKPPLLREAASANYFISYSRSDLTIVSQLKEFLEGRATSVWFDNDRINVGDNWMAEIESGIAHSDELLLIVSNASARSPVVLQEIQIALSQGKEVRPIVVERLNIPLPSTLGSIQYIDLSDRLDLHKLARAIEPEPAHLAAINKGNVTLTVKRNACRRFWPVFSEDLIAAGTRPNLLLVSATIETMLDRYPSSSAVWLNSGMVRCVLGDWETGLNRLREHSVASGSFAGWYMYALHLSRGEPVRLLSPAVGRDAEIALQKIESFGLNFLCMLLRAIYDFEFHNRDYTQLDATFQRCVEAHHSFPDAPAEYLRFYWCMRNSFTAFREYRDNVVNLIKAHGGIA